MVEVWVVFMAMSNCSCRLFFFLFASRVGLVPIDRTAPEALGERRE